MIGFASSPFRSLAPVAWLLGLLLVSTGVVAEEKPSPEQEKFFEEKIRPVFAERCYECHGAKKQESELRLDSKAAAVRPAASGEAAIVPGDPAKSTLLRAVRKEGELKMPPEGKLSEEQIAAIEQWIRLGAPWPAGENAPVVLSAVERVEPHRREHWAYQKVVAPPVPKIENGPQVFNDIDRFILDKLNSKGIAPVPQADRRTLLRRLTFDLIGLPPTFEELEVFAADESPEAYERAVDRLLASEHYGERWGRHWLDVARYADSLGYAFQRERRYPYAYTYRDYVVRSLNRDLPYDQFIREQLAADLLPGQANNESLAALGFITVGRKFLAIHDTYDDQIDVVTRGLLGLTVACARCHDHKYDAVPMDDYYSLYGVFASLNEPEPDELPVIGDPEKIAGFREFDAEMKRLNGELTKYLEQKSRELAEEAEAKTVDYLARVLVKPESDLFEKFEFLTVKSSNDLRSKLLEKWRAYMKRQARPIDASFGFFAAASEISETEFPEKVESLLARFRDLPSGIGEKQINPLIQEAIRNTPPREKLEVAKLYADLMRKAMEAWRALGGGDDDFEKLSDELRPFAHAFLDREGPGYLRTENVERIFRRDEQDKVRNLKKAVEKFQADSPNAPPRAMVVQEKEHPYNPRVFQRGDPGRPGKEVPRRFLLLASQTPEREPFRQGSGRLQLAEAIASPENPLTRRVLVNRVWMHHFGEPLVETPSDFGIRTPRPVQAELLDHLAERFLAEGWSLKKLHKAIVTSAAYRRSSQYDAKNAELDPENRLLWRMNRRRLEWEPLRDALLFASGRLDRTLGGRAVNITAPNSVRRTLYGTLDRQDLPNLFRVFDLPGPDASNPKRARTTIPQQGLFLMNAPFVLEQAAALAKRPEIASAADDQSRVSALFHFTLAREPSPVEREAIITFIREASEKPAEAQLSPWEQAAHALLMTNEFAYVD